MNKIARCWRKKWFPKPNTLAKVETTLEAVKLSQIQLASDPV